MASTFERRKLEFADRLVALREAVPASGKQLAQVLGWHPSKVSKIETGRQLPTDSDLEAYLQAAQAPAELLAEMRAGLRDLRIDKATWKRQLRGGHRRRQEQGVAEERAASSIRTVDVFGPTGILQTPAVARANFLTQARLLGVPADDVDAAVRARMERQQILYEPGRRIEILLSEAALGMAVCSREELRAQVDRVAWATQLPDVRIGVLPLHVQYPFLVPHGWWIVDDEVLLELVHTEVRISDPEQVAIYERMTDALWSVAVEGDEARELLRRIPT